MNELRKDLPTWAQKLNEAPQDKLDKELEVFYGNNGYVRYPAFEDMNAGEYFYFNPPSFASIQRRVDRFHAGLCLEWRLDGPVVAVEINGTRCLCRRTRNACRI